MKTIAEIMRKGESARKRKALGEKTLLHLELRLIAARDFYPEKVGYYQQRINETKKTFNL